MFLRELPEHLLTFNLFADIMLLQGLSDEAAQVTLVRSLLLRLPASNRRVLEYLVRFLAEVVTHSQQNLMTAMNLAIVFGPNLVWSREPSSSLTAMREINCFVNLLIKACDPIFAEDAPTEVSPFAPALCAFGGPCRSACLHCGEAAVHVCV
eukprot:Colp12_sorted_trinity150504_noHs@6115